MSQYLEAYSKVKGRIEGLAQHDILSRDKARVLKYWLNTSRRIREVGDGEGSWDLLEEVVQQTPGVSIKQT